MATPERAAGGRSAAKVVVGGRGGANVSTGLSVLDHLLALLASRACFDVSVDVEPGDIGDEVVAAGRALGGALREHLHADGARGHGSAVVPADEAMAHVALEASDRPLVVSNVDLSSEHVGGLGIDVVSGFLRPLAEAAGLTLHVRLIEGRDTQHVLDAIFKTLGVALAQACAHKRR